ncbi:MAG: CHASE2 domain-containing protein [Rhodoferax sp.]|nr:CHASE2 domain-containing protein [Rhodoferax sp.]
MNQLIALFGRAFLYQRGRVAASAFLLFFAALVGFAETITEAGQANSARPEWTRVLAVPAASVRQLLFDAYQRAFPRVRQEQKVAIVGIDEKSLKAVGQWPWPRNKLAELIDAITVFGPKAIGLDIFMPEADQTSPERVATNLGSAAPELGAALRMLPGHDARLARALAQSPSVLGAAGFGFETLITSAGMRTWPVLAQGADPLPFVRRFPFVRASLPELQAAAQGQALLSIEETAVVRRIPLVAAVGDLLVPSLAMEMLRVASGGGAIELAADRHGVRSVSVADLTVETQSGGDVWLHFAPEQQGIAAHRNISAATLLSGKVAGEALTGKLVLIGLTGSGLNDRRVTSLGESVAGIEIQAQLLESLLDGRFLLRPWWMKWLELGLLLGIGALMVWRVPNALRGQSGAQSQRPPRVGWWVIAVVVSVIATGFALFYSTGWLFDGATMSIGFAGLLASLVSSSTLETENDNRRLALEKQELREQAARLAGEMEAARRIQLGSLPDASRAFPGERRFAIDALIEPAREVGGDLYDFFMIDQRRLCFLIGDVSGKGVPASLFMAVAKALSRSFATRLAGGPAEIVSAANLDLSRENVETLFVTMLLGVLDVDTGALELVNAGHEGPWCLGADGSLRQIVTEAAQGGPPLCVVDDFSYQVHRLQLAPGDRLCMVTDGITEAMDRTGQLFGASRLREALATLALAPSATEIRAQVRRDVGLFVGHAEPSDDLAILIVHWKGSSPSA